MYKKIGVFIFLFLFCAGIEYELQNLVTLNLTLFDLKNLLIGTLLLIVYIVPFAVVCHKINKSWHLPEYIPVISILAGLFITGWISAFGNDFTSIQLDLMFPHNSFISTWEDSLTAPFVEEFIKLFCALWVLHLCKRNSFKSYFIVGISVGFGFQIIEDFNYLLDGLDNVVENALIRDSGALSSHWTYTGIATSGIFMFKHSNKLVGTLLVIAPIFLHFIWNSPLNNSNSPINLVATLVSASTLFIIYMLYRTVNNKTELAYSDAS